MRSRYEYMEYATADSRHEVVLQLGKKRTSTAYSSLID
jgi:hypothetical protein